MAEPKNQTEAEFFAVATTGRRGLDEMADKMGGEIMAIAARDVAAAGPTWLKRAIVSIANDEKLAPVLQTRTGLFSVYKALAKAATMGLQMGGQFPHGYLTPYAGKVELIVSVDGYKHAATNGPGAVLSSIEVRRVYDGEDIKINIGKAEIDHCIDVKKERGPLVGVYGIIIKRDGTRSVCYMTKTEALAIRNAHSRSYKEGKGPWVNGDEDAMIEKTAAKNFLRRYAAESEGLAMLYGQDVDEPAEEQTPPPRDIADRMAGHLDRATERADAAPPMRNATPETPAEPEHEPEPETPAEPAPGKQKELF